MEFTSSEFEVAHKIVPMRLTQFIRQGKRKRTRYLIWQCDSVLVFNNCASPKKQGKYLLTIWRGWWQNPPSVSLKIWPHTFSSTSITCLWAC